MHIKLENTKNFYVLWVMINVFKSITEYFGFGVCNWLSPRLGIHATRVRLYFIYLSFVAFGSTIFIYLILAFWLNVKKYARDFFAYSVN
jgi:phage shock protein PspC (stress-responsive transcriptional regulator)